MKTISTFTLATLLLTSFACAQAPVFTTLSSTGKNIFAGVKKETKGSEPETYLLKVSGDSLTSDKVALPKELTHREVVALFPAENNLLVVMSQRTVEQGDKPQFHSYNSDKKEWKKLAETNCISFSKIKVELHALNISCLETNAKGEEVESTKKVDLKGVKFSQTGNVTLPVAKVEKASLKAELLGETFEWKELKVGLDKKQKIFRP
jgi:hypothetical protein